MERQDLQHSAETHRPRSMNASRKIAVITGASSDLGLELTKLLAKDRMDLYLVGEDEQWLASTAVEIRKSYQVTVHAIAQNLAHADAAQVLGRTLEEMGISAIDVLVNDACIGRWGQFAELPLEDHLKVIAVNLFGLTSLTHRLLPQLVRAQGKVLNLASVAYFQPGPNMAVYYATKAYVQSLSLALAEEFKSLGIGVTALCPGPTDTEFSRRAWMEDRPAFRSPMVMNQADVAETGYRAMMKSGLEGFLPTSLLAPPSSALREASA